MSDINWLDQVEIPDGLELENIHMEKQVFDVYRRQMVALISFFEYHKMSPKVSLIKVPIVAKAKIKKAPLLACQWILNQNYALSNRRMLLDFCVKNGECVLSAVQIRRIIQGNCPSFKLPFNLI